MTGSTTEAGFAVLDLETTGLGRDRIVEVAVVSVDPKGVATQEWSTLVDPNRDVGPTGIHGVQARDLLDAPTFEDIAADLADLLTGRVVVAHNLAFDARMLRQEYERLGYPEVPLTYAQGVCTMKLAPRYLPLASRSLQDCCLAAGWEHHDAHEALGDARATARLLACYLSHTEGSEDWLRLLDEAPSWGWPCIPRPSKPRSIWTRQHVALQRAASENGRGPEHFLARLVPALPRVPDPPMADPYLAILDDALADRRVDSHEADTLVSAAKELGLDRGAVETLHRGYLTSLAHAAWEDGVVDEHELDDLVDVARLLGLPAECVAQALHDGQHDDAGPDLPRGSLRLEVGDKICFTGAIPGREDLIFQATQAGLRVMSNVSRKTALVVCADTTSKSGKAKKAREVGTPLVAAQKFRQLLAALQADVE